MNASQKNDKSKVLTLTGISVMILMIPTRFVPGLDVAKYSMFVGLAFFFIVEAAAKTPDAESGLRFRTFFSDLKKPGALIFMLLPVVTSIASIFLGNMLFGSGYVDHVFGRTEDVLDYGNIALLAGEFLVAALGEEIAFRGFFTGKGMDIFPYPLCMVLSSAFFALAHFSAGDTRVVVYDLAGIFIDALIYSAVFKKTGNCLVSTAAHFLCNMSGIIYIMLTMK